MPNKSFVMDLAKLLIAAAWADGSMTNSETNSLKDLLFTIPDISADEWSRLDVYMDSPCTTEEQQQLLLRVVENVSSTEDKNLVVSTLTALFEADGEVSADEQAFLADVTNALEGASTGLLSRLSKIMRSATTRRGANQPAPTEREAATDDFVKNTIYYQLSTAADAAHVVLDLPDDRIRKLCLSAGVLAKVAYADAEVSSEERDAIADILAAEWNLSKEQATLLASISTDRTVAGLDYFRLTRGFFDCTDYQERARFLTVLFKVANASGKTSNDEIEGIRKIASSLKVSHKDFIDAKLTISRDDRGGL